MVGGRNWIPGNTMRRAGWIGVVLVALVGCGDVVPKISTSAKSPTAGSQFDAAATGTLAGEVKWIGPQPTVPPIDVVRFLSDGTKTEHFRFVNPHAPPVDANGNVAGAVVYLRNVDPTRSKAWNHPPVTVEMADGHPMIRQGDVSRLVGFVHRGDSVTMVSKQPIFHSLKARGAAFFTYTLPDPNKPRQRLLSERGHVELSSAAGQMALRGHLFVDDHPYYALTDANGRFQLEQVPAGKYEVVCWRPNWNVERFEHDPETLFNVRLHYKPAFEKIATATVVVGESATLNFDVGQE